MMLISMKGVLLGADRSGNCLFTTVAVGFGFYFLPCVGGLLSEFGNSTSCTSMRFTGYLADLTTMQLRTEEHT